MMANPFSALNRANPMNSYDFGRMRNAYQMLANSRNPMAVFQQMAGSNPQMQPILQALRNGQDPQRLFNSLCQQRGIDPNQFIQSLTGQNR